MRWQTWMMAAALALPIGVHAQDAPLGFDPALLTASAGELLQRVPDAQADALLLAVHDAMQDEAQAQRVCGLFDPQADRSLQGLDALARQLDPASRDRFANAVGDALVAALQSPPHADDAALATQSLKATAVTAALLHDGFTAGFDAPADAPDARAQRCRSLRWLLDAMQSRPVAERAAMTRLLLRQGLAKLAPGG